MLNSKFKQNGAVMAELAILLPLFLVLAIGVTELGTAFFAQNTLNKAVREGARLKTYAMDPYLPSGVTISDTTIENQVKNIMNGLPSFYPQGNATSVNIDTPIVGGLQHARVSATYNHQLLLGQLFSSLLSFFGGNFSSSIPLSAQATMRVQLP
jgi:hypothetical protein